MPKSILAGLLLTITTVGIHATGTSWWIQRLHQQRSDRSRHRGPLRTLCATATLLLMLQISEVVLWAVAYLMLPSLSEINTFEQAVYFSTVCFTTLGFGDIVISGDWRLLAAIQAMAGLLIFGWSTALFFAVFERVWLRDPVPRPNEPVN